MGDFAKKEVSGAVVLEFGDDFSRPRFVALEKAVADTVHDGKSHIAVNMSGIQTISSDGMALLVPMHDRCGTAGGKLVLFGLSDRAIQVMSLASLDSFFTIRPDEKAALAELGAGPKKKVPLKSRSKRVVAKPKVAADESRVRDVIARLVQSRMHALILERAAAKGVASIKDMASTLGVSPGTLKRPFVALTKAGVLKLEKGDSFRFAPGEAERVDIELFLKGWGDPVMRSRIAAWLLAQEKTSS